jgi:Holliday junction resolvase RusA-like endonuclease
MITFTVPGEPVAKGRPKATTINGMARLYTPKKTVNYEAMVALAAQIAMRGKPLLEGPVELSFEARFSIPKGWTKKRLAAHAVSPEFVTKKPDLDNLEKALGDGMNGVVFADDSQIAQTGVCRKVYGAVPGVTVTVRALIESPVAVDEPSLLVPA